MWVTEEVRVLIKFLYCLWVFMLGGTACPAWADSVRISNRLAACSTVSLKSTETIHNLVLAHARIDLKASIGDCGCKSALANYASFADRGKQPQMLQKGVISMMEAGDRTFVLASDPALVKNANVRLTIDCAAPL